MQIRFIRCGAIESLTVHSSVHAMQKKSGIMQYNTQCGGVRFFATALHFMIEFRTALPNFVSTRTITMRNVSNTLYILCLTGDFVIQFASSHKALRAISLHVHLQRFYWGKR
jgi:hypothetical protein